MQPDLPHLELLPHLRVRRLLTKPYRSPRGYYGERPIPERDTAAHAADLLAYVETLEQGFVRADGQIERPAEAEGHLITAEALKETELRASSLGDKRTDAVVVVETNERAIVHVRHDELLPLKRKIEDYGNPEKSTRSGRPRNEALVAPLELLRLTTLGDLSGGTLDTATVDDEQNYWVELWVRGGRLEEESVRTRVLEEIRWLARQHDIPIERVHSFRATERDVYLLPLPGRALRLLPNRIPEVYRVIEATRGLRDFVVSELATELVQPDHVATPPTNAPAVVILDTGISPEHPLLAPTFLDQGASVIIGDPSPVDIHGHGTEMAGLAAYRDLGRDLLYAGEAQPRVWLQSVRLLADDQTNDDDREFWPERTEQGVLAAEAEGKRSRVFNLCVSAAHPDPGMRTSWSVGLDLLAYDEGLGRLFCVAVGNVDVSPRRDDYPNLNLTSFIDDPAQALNVIAVGALTDRTAIPADPVHGDLVALAGEGQLSPFSRCGVPGANPIKPEIVFEGGNCAPDGVLAGFGIETLSLLSTSRRHKEGRLLTFSWATSAACASLSGFVAEIWHANPNLRPATIRALAVHSARWTDGLRNQFSDRRDLVRAAGYGVPNVSKASYSLRARPTLIVEDELRPSVVDERNRRRREHHLVRLPLPSEALLELGEHEVELSATLSYFVEPNEANRANYAGTTLRWDLQRPGEDEVSFGQRINRLERGDDYQERGVAYPWEIGPDSRGRGSVQSDRCRVTAASLAGDKLIAVFPVLGWWEGKRQRLDATAPYSLVITIDAGDAPIDLYAMIEAEVSVQIPAV